jgi:hypothetical protein
MGLLRALVFGSPYVRRVVLYALWVRLVVLLSPFEG